MNKPTKEIQIYFFNKEEASVFKHLEGCMSFKLNPSNSQKRFYGIYDRKGNQISFSQNLKLAFAKIDSKMSYQTVYRNISENGFYVENGMIIIQHHMD